jgi:hypothetical protein
MCCHLSWGPLVTKIHRCISAVLSAYVYYTLTPAYYQLGTSYIKATALATNVVAGVVGDLLVVVWDVSLRTLMWISAVSVCLGYIVGVFVLQRPTVLHSPCESIDHDGSMREPLLRHNSAETVHGTGDTIIRDRRRKSLDISGTSNDNNNTAVDNNNEQRSRPVVPQRSMADKVREFKQQLHYLVVAFRSRTLVVLIAYWVVGNAVYSVS